MSAAAPLLRIPVGVVVERRKATSAWADFLWRPVAVLPGQPDAVPWTLLGHEGETATFYAGTAEIELYRTETDNYRGNLALDASLLWVALHPGDGDQPYRLVAVTADPAEGEAWTEPGQGIVEALPMPAAVREIIADFIARHHIERGFEKRKRDQADPEALARGGPRKGHDDGR